VYLTARSSPDATEGKFQAGKFGFLGHSQRDSLGEELPPWGRRLLVRTVWGFVASSFIGGLEAAVPVKVPSLGRRGSCVQLLLRGF